MEHTLYILEKERDGGIKDLILGLAKHLDATTQIRDVLVVETDDARLAGMARTLAEANGELVDLVHAQDFPGLMTREAAMTTWLGADEPALEAIEKGEGRLPILTNEDHAETHGQTPAPETAAETPAEPKRKRTFKARLCPVCLQEYIPTGPRAKHLDCPGKDNGPKVNEINRQLREKKFVSFKQEEPEEWQHAETGDRYRESDLRDKVLKGKFPVGALFTHDRRGEYVVKQRNFRFVLSRVQVKQPEGEMP